MYKYTLEKYRGKKTRFTCPDCGHANEFTRYQDSETGDYLDESVGICNRLKKCGYHYTPKQFFADNPDFVKQDSIRTSNQRRALPPNSSITNGFDFIKAEVLKETVNHGYNLNNFVQFLFSRFDKEKVADALAAYLVGTWDDGRTVFWQIDEKRRIRSGKLMQYSPTTGKRVKDKLSWVHSQLLSKGELSEPFRLKQCLFGEHLLATAPGKSVGIVESEKSAIIASVLLPSHVWVAVGGNKLSPEKLKPLKNRQINLFPDGDSYGDWLFDAWQLKARGFDVKVSDIIDAQIIPELKEDGFDLADFLIRTSEYERYNKLLTKMHELPNHCPKCKGKVERVETSPVIVFRCAVECSYERHYYNHGASVAFHQLWRRLTGEDSDRIREILTDSFRKYNQQGFSDEFAMLLTCHETLPRILCMYDYN